MNQGSRIFDDLGRLMNDAAGMADGVRREVETAVRSQAERFVMDMDLVKREDFDALRELVLAQGEEIAQLRAELTALKGKSGTEAVG
ncbi:accessory factor UbiK family protein [Arsenicitalea aurantiaca]|uniref:Accessory factor UbiK family protein n=1 Tax=Arsenicitalea aurantiaca TaxID=1783274 RepID=A0A433XLV8_9HYPH|nr:accessory factor UbiK family protein [Arsenicitalea aurantiaca]RUT34968.1 accessory factor UbiK family protein [Arsenicitalea aurantiaca]